MKTSKVFVLGLEMDTQIKEVSPARVELLNSGIQNKTDALRAWSHRGCQRKVFLCSNHYVPVGFNGLFNAPERVLCHRDPELIPRVYLFTWNSNCGCFVFGWVGRDGGGKCIQSGSSKTVTHCLDTVITKGIYNTCVCDMLNTTKMKFKVFLTVFSYRLQWRAYNRSEWGQSVNIKILSVSVVQPLDVNNVC